MRLFSDDGGDDGLPVVFLHSAGGNVSQWVGQLEHVRRSRRGVALDLRGHGRSAAPEDVDFAIPTLAKDVKETLTDLGIDEAVLIGHSLGAIVALEYAGRNPGRVRGLMLADPAGDFTRVPREMMDQLFAGLESDAYGETIGAYWSANLVGSVPEVEERVLADLKATSRETMIGLFQAQVDYDPASALRRYKRTKLALVTPNNDAPFSLQNLGEELPHEFFTGTGHWLQMDRPEEFNRKLDEFLASVDPETTDERGG